MDDETFPQELADALVGVQRLLRRRLRASLTVPRLRGGEAELLRLVRARPGIGISEAAKELYLAGNSVSTLVNQLVKDGFLVRETDPADRRAARLRLTEAAETRLREWKARRAELVGRHVEHLDATDREALRAALPALRTLAVRLQEDLDEGAEEAAEETGDAPKGRTAPASLHLQEAAAPPHPEGDAEPAAPHPQEDAV